MSSCPGMNTSKSPATKEVTIIKVSVYCIHNSQHSSVPNKILNYLYKVIFKTGFESFYSCCVVESSLVLSVHLSVNLCGYESILVRHILHFLKGKVSVWFSTKVHFCYCMVLSSPTL